MMSDDNLYRIRWADVRCSNGYRQYIERMCIAERKTRWFGWWPCANAEWRREEGLARSDAQNDAALRAPLPPPIILTAVDL